MAALRALAGIGDLASGIVLAFRALQAISAGTGRALAAGGAGRILLAMTAAAHPPEAATTATAKDLNATLARIRAAARDAGVPSYDARIESLEKLERALRKRKDAIAQAIARDFGNRSKHETYVA
jgi:acyl-CoA reductase-like NAD-dependent aldehyde dehydrogenase